MVTVVMGVTDSLCGHMQLCEGAQGDAGLLDGVDEAVLRRRRHRVAQLLRTTRRVRRHQDVGIQDDLLTFHQAHGPAQQHQVTCGSRGEVTMRTRCRPQVVSSVTSDLSGAC